MLNLTGHGENMPENIEKSSIEELEEAVKNLSQKVETLWNENVALYQKSEKSDTWLVHLIGCCKDMVRRVDALEEKCSALTQGLELQNLHIDPLGMTINIEEKGLNNDSFISEMFQIQAPRISDLPKLTMDEFAAAKDEFTTVIGGVPQLEPEYKNVPSHGINVWPEPTATIPTSRKRKAQEMTESRPDTPSPPSSSYSAPITFLNTFSDDVPIRGPTKNGIRRAGRPKASMPLAPPLEEPAQEQQVQEAQNGEEELQVTEEEHSAAIHVLFETSNFIYDDSEYDLFRTSNWV